MSRLRCRRSSLAVFAAVLLTACGPAEAPKPQRPDATKEAWYAPATAQLAQLNQQASAALQAGKTDDASAIVQHAEGLAQRLISVPSPTYEATAAVSDRDELYGRMLMKNKHYGWARMEFQKNVARWRNWRPETEDSKRRREAAEALVAACDRELK
jgi:hypothetical protein